jgi:peroxiredoxin
VKLHEEFKGTDLVLLKVAIKDKEEDVKKYKNEFNISTPIMIDDGQVANAYGVWSHPETFLINREGKIVGRALKGMDWSSKNMKNLLHHLLKEGK